MATMRIPLTHYGWPQSVVYPAVVVAGMALVGLAGPSVVSTATVVIIEAALAAVLIWALMFFRDPKRHVPLDPNVLLACADGKVTDIEMVEEDDFIGGPALRIGVFLSIFNVHINRAPCRARVEKITYRKGKYVNAMNPLSSKVNESNAVGMVRTEAPQDRLIVKQISGAIARRIVCATEQGRELAQGQDFGMIKFGSRTELYVPASDKIEPLVNIGDKVKAGITPMVRYRR